MIPRYEFWIVSLWIQFVDKPGQPIGPLKPEEVRADHIKVSWKKPKDNGGSEITGYIVEKMELDSGQWIPAGEVCSLIKILVHVKI